MTGLAIHFHASAVQGHNPPALGKPQAESASGFASGKIRLERVPANVFGQARTVVAHLDARPDSRVAVRVGFLPRSSRGRDERDDHLNFSAVGHRLQCVATNGVNRGGNQRFIGNDLNGPFQPAALELCLLPRRTLPQAVDHVQSSGRQIHRSEIRGRWMCEQHQVGDHLVRSERLTVDCRQLAPSLWILFVAQQRLRASRDVGQRVVDFVSGAVRQFLDGR